jgi:tetratricopeptide (TPR) repeat protein
VYHENQERRAISVLHLSFILVSALTFQFAQVSPPAESAAASPPSIPAQSAPPPRPALSPQERGDIQMARKMYREAIETYKEAPESAAILNRIGIAYHQLSDLDNAAKYYSRAMKLDRNFTEAMNNLGTIYYTRKSYRKAINLYKKVLKIKPNSASTLANLGSAYFARKQYQLASEAYQQALEIDPDVFEIHNGTGPSVRESTIGDRPVFYYTLAKTYAKKGFNDKALLFVRKALEEGFKDRKKFLEEPEFAGLKDNPEFQKLMMMEPRVL